MNASWRVFMGGLVEHSTYNMHSGDKMINLNVYFEVSLHIMDLKITKVSRG